MPDIKIPSEPTSPSSPLITRLTIAASALTTASIAINLILQIAQFLKKRPIEPDQRDRLQAAGLTLNVLRHMPPLIRQARLFIHLLRS